MNPRLIVAKEQEAFQVHALVHTHDGIPIYEPIFGQSYPDSYKAARAIVNLLPLIEKGINEALATKAGT